MTAAEFVPRTQPSPPMHWHGHHYVRLAAPPAAPLVAARVVPQSQARAIRHCSCFIRNSQSRSSPSYSTQRDRFVEPQLRALASIAMLSSSSGRQQEHRTAGTSHRETAQPSQALRAERRLRSAASSSSATTGTRRRKQQIERRAAAPAHESPTGRRERSQPTKSLARFPRRFSLLAPLRLYPHASHAVEQSFPAAERFGTLPPCRRSSTATCCASFCRCW